MAEQRKKVALVTGASRGIGRAIALGLAGRGFAVALNDIESQRVALEAVAGAIAETGSQAFVATADVSSKPEVGKMIDAVVGEFGRIDAVVNNAGILISGTVEDLPEETWDSVLDVNAKGTFLVVQAVLPIMKKQNYGRIVNIASIGGKHGAPEQAHYSASKAAIMGFTRVLAQEVGERRHHRQLRLPRHHRHRNGPNQSRRPSREGSLARKDRNAADRRAGGCRRSRCILRFRRCRVRYRPVSKRRWRDRIELIGIAIKVLSCCCRRRH